MIGLKIAATGLICFLVAMTCIRGEWPGAAIGFPLLVLFAGGLCAMVAGLLMMVWL